MDFLSVGKATKGVYRALIRLLKRLEVIETGVIWALLALICGLKETVSWRLTSEINYRQF